MDIVHVTEVLDDRAKVGKTKTGKDYTMSRVGLSNGESTFIFNPIEIGDVVEEQINGEYKNWAKKKLDPKHEEIMKALREIYKAITGGYPEKEATITVDMNAEPVSVRPEIDKEIEEQRFVTKKPEVIAEVPDDDIRLGDIPF